MKKRGVGSTGALNPGSLEAADRYGADTSSAVSDWARPSTPPHPPPQQRTAPEEGGARQQLSWFGSCTISPASGFARGTQADGTVMPLATHQGGGRGWFPLSWTGGPRALSIPTTQNVSGPGSSRTGHKTPERPEPPWGSGEDWKEGPTHFASGVCGPPPTPGLPQPSAPQS